MDWTLIVIAAVGVLSWLVVKRLTLVPIGKARELLLAGAVIVDVRSPGEFDSRHLPKAVNVPLGELKTEAPRRLPDKNRPLLLHCLSGARSGIAKRQLSRLGYTDVHNLGSYGRAKEITSTAKG